MKSTQQKDLAGYCFFEKRCKAFSLVELLVVISVIALLMAILLPALRRAKSSARQILCASNINQVSLALRSYASDNNDRIIIAGEILYTHSSQEVARQLHSGRRVVCMR